MIDLYLVVSTIFFVGTGFAAQREAESHQDFKLLYGGGVYNFYRYYKYLKKNNEPLSLKFKLYFIAQVNFVFIGFLWVYMMLFT